MISNQVLQNTLEGLKEISRTEFCVLDTEGKVLASTFADFFHCNTGCTGFRRITGRQPACKGGSSILKSVMTISWNIYWSPMATMKILIWLASSPLFRSRI